MKLASSPGARPARGGSRRASGVLAAAVAVAATLAPVRPALAARPNSVGLIDYSHKNFKVGDWVRYRVATSTSEGLEDVKYQETRIVGEDDFRGEPCFWVETWYGDNSDHADYNLTLVSYDVFKNPDADVRFSLYIRLMQFGADDEGVVDMIEVKRAGDGKGPLPDPATLRGEIDTLGTETVHTPKGDLSAQVIEQHRNIRTTYTQPDSTILRYSETRRRGWHTRRVPITSLARERDINEFKRQAYKLGEVSTDAPMMLERSVTQDVTVIDWGTGATSEILEAWRKKKGFVSLPTAGGAPRAE